MSSETMGALNTPGVLVFNYKKTKPHLNILDEFIYREGLCALSNDNPNHAYQMFSI